MQTFTFNDGAITIGDSRGTLQFESLDGERKCVVDMEPVLNKLYNLGVLDAEGSFFFQRQLEYIKARSYDVLYPELKAREVFPVSNEAGPGVTTIVYRTYDKRGQAKIINAASGDAPRSDVAGQESIIPVVSVGTSYGYTLDEIQSARFTGQPIDQRRAEAAMRANEEKINDIAFFGDADSGLTGLFNNPLIPTGQVAGGTWESKAPDLVIFDVNAMFASIWESSLMIERPNTLLLPPQQYSYIMSTPRSTTSDTTIGQYLVQNSQYLNSMDDIIPLNQCVAANNPDLTEDAMVGYHRVPEKLQLEIPVEMQALPLQEKGFEYVIHNRSRVAGVNFYYPNAVAIFTGI